MNYVIEDILFSIRSSFLIVTLLYVFGVCALMFRIGAIFIFKRLLFPVSLRRFDTALTFVHELSHAFACILFAHKIITFNLSENPGVAHEWNGDNIYQNLGVFFISLAPVILSSAVLYVFVVLEHYILFCLALPFLLIMAAPSKEDFISSFKSLYSGFASLFLIILTYKIIISFLSL